MKWYANPGVVVLWKIKRTAARRQLTTVELVIVTNAEFSITLSTVFISRGRKTHGDVAWTFFYRTWLAYISFKKIRKTFVAGSAR
jgi:hypothetical protein